MDDLKNNIISMEIPLSDAYVGVLRLVAASAACRAMLDIDKTEDAKVIVTEIINELLEEKKKEEKVSVRFTVEKEILYIEFLDISYPSLIDEENESMRSCIIRALCDELKYNDENKAIRISIKAGKGI